MAPYVSWQIKSIAVGIICSASTLTEKLNNFLMTGSKAGGNKRSN
jgi:hypothetical protein